MSLPQGTRISNANSIAAICSAGPLTICVIGPPGSQAAEHARAVAERNRVPFVSMDGLLDYSIETMTFLGPAAKHFRDMGEPIPAAVMQHILLKRLCELDCTDCGWVLEGFPRTTSDVEFLSAHGQLPSKVIVLDIRDEVVQQRTHGQRNEDLRTYRDNITAVLDALDVMQVSVVEIDANPTESDWRAAGWDPARDQAAAAGILEGMRRPRPRRASRDGDGDADCDGDGQKRPPPPASTDAAGNAVDPVVTDRIDTAVINAAAGDGDGDDDVPRNEEAVFIPTPGITDPSTDLSRTSSSDSVSSDLKESWGKGFSPQSPPIASIIPPRPRLRRHVVHGDVFYLPLYYQQLTHVGGGAYGHVIQAWDSRPDQRRNVAIKKIRQLTTRHRSELNRYSYIHRAFREMLVMLHVSRSRTRCPFVMPLVDVIPPRSFETFDDLTIVMPLMGRDLASALRHKHFSRRVPLDDMATRRWMYQLICGLLLLHSMRILHRDIKGENILMSRDRLREGDRDPYLVLMDYGLARGTETPLTPGSDEQEGEGGGDGDECCDGDGHRAPTVTHDGAGGLSLDEKTREMMSTYMLCTQYYRSPELCMYDQKADPALDVWSLGCIFAEMLFPVRSRRILFKGRYYASDYERSCDAQLRSIFEVLGTPPAPSKKPGHHNHNDNDNELVGMKTRIEKVRAKLPHQEGAGLESLLPDAHPDAMDLLRRMLAINPRNRISLRDALDHPYIVPAREDNPEACEFGEVGPFFINYAMIRSRHFNRPLSSKMLKAELFRLIHEEMERRWGCRGDPEIVEN